MKQTNNKFIFEDNEKEEAARSIDNSLNDDAEQQEEIIDAELDENNSYNEEEKKEKFYLDIKIQTKIFACLLAAFAVLLFLALVSHTVQDDTNSQIEFYELFYMFSDDPVIKFKVDTTMNLLGLFGAYISDFLINRTIGLFILGVPIFLFVWGIKLYKKGEVPNKTINYTNLYLIFSLVIVCLLGTLTFFSPFANIPQKYYGAIGIFIPSILSKIISPIGTLIVLLLVLGLLLYKLTSFKTLGVKQTFKVLFSYLNIKTLIAKLNAMVNDPNAEDSSQSKEQNKPSENANKAEENKTVQNKKTENKNAANNSYNNNINNTKKPELVFKDHSIEQKPKPTSIFDVTNVFDLDKTQTFTNYELHDDNFLDKFNPSKSNYIENGIDVDDNDNNNFANIINNDNINNRRNEVQEAVDNTERMQRAVIPPAVISNTANNDNHAGRLNNNINNFNKVNNAGSIDIDLPAQKYVSNDEIDYLIKDNRPIEQEYINISENRINKTADLNNQTKVIKDEMPDKPILTLQVDPEISINKYDNKPITNDNLPEIEIDNSKSEYDAFNNPLSLKVLDEKIKYDRPNFDLLEYGNETYADDAELREKAATLYAKLKTFNITISKPQVTKGPVVTQYEFVPDDGIKLSKIEGLEDDLAMALKAKSIRILAPVPGKGTVGIQIPNSKPSIVKFRNVIETKNFINNKYELPIALGKTISGEPYIADLTKMPHLLIAGSTGSGKSVGVNTIIASLLYKKHPKQLKFIIIDPKKVELQQYSVLSKHFLAVSPEVNSEIVTEPADAITVLQAAVIEMETRYDILASVGQRNIKDYNEKVRSGAFDHIKDFTHRELPYIVVIIDELADLMLISKKEIETSIVRLAQKARAIGIHLIVATQNPSTDVITGIIKANFPSRIAYRVASKSDSRVILDKYGAEKLLGNGDMLFLLYDETIKIYNPFISIDEIKKICSFIGNQTGYSKPYLLPYINEQSDGDSINTSDFDPLLREAAEIVIEQQQASISNLQRRLGIGFARAGRIVDQLEEAGVVGKSQGSKPRPVLLESMADLERIL